MHQERLREAIPLLLAFLACLLAASPIRAEVVKDLRITSIPSGAEVFLKRGTRHLEPGETPLTYTAILHSEMSVLRMLFQKEGV